MLGASFLIAGVARDIDVLWCFSQDMFPFKTPIKESQVRFIISFQVTCKKNMQSAFQGFCYFELVELFNKTQQRALKSCGWTQYEKVLRIFYYLFFCGGILLNLQFYGSVGKKFDFWQKAL